MVEGHAMTKHVHMVMNLPLKCSVSSDIGYLKGKLVIMIQREMAKSKEWFYRKHFLANGDFFSTDVL